MMTTRDIAGDKHKDLLIFVGKDVVEFVGVWDVMHISNRKPKGGEEQQK